jgi:predicted transcriptional regulator
MRRDIDRKILAYLMKQDWPVTTEMIARELNLSWNTAQVHLWRLAAGDLVKGRKVGRQNQWIVTEKGRNPPA